MCSDFAKPRHHAPHPAGHGWRGGGFEAAAGHNTLSASQLFDMGMKELSVILGEEQEGDGDWLRGLVPPEDEADIREALLEAGPDLEPGEAGQLVRF